MEIDEQNKSEENGQAGGMKKTQPPFPRAFLTARMYREHDAESAGSKWRQTRYNLVGTEER